MQGSDGQYSSRPLTAIVLFQFLAVVRHVVRHRHETKVRREPTDVRIGILSRVATTRDRRSTGFGRTRGRRTQRTCTRPRSWTPGPYVTIPSRVRKVSSRVRGVVRVIRSLIDADHASRTGHPYLSRSVVGCQWPIIVTVWGWVWTHSLRMSPRPTNAQRPWLSIVPRVHAVRGSRSRTR